MAQMPLAVCGIFVMLLGFVASSGEGKLPRLNCIIPSRYHDKFYYNRLSGIFFLSFFFFLFPSFFFLLFFLTRRFNASKLSCNVV